MSINPEYAESVYFLVEVRARLLRFVIVLFVAFAGLIYFSNNLYTLLARPLLRYLPQGHLIATQIVSPFVVPFKLAFIAAIVLCIPYLIYQVWSFIAPALYVHERRLMWPFILVSVLLFYVGIVFAYLVIFPMLFHFLVQVAPVGVMFSPDIAEYLDFTIKMLMVFGCLFEIPMVMVICVALNVVTRDQFVHWRSYAIVSAFILGMLLAPPDVISQTILAVPIWLLYEVGIVMTRFLRASTRGLQ